LLDERVEAGEEGGGLDGGLVHLPVAGDQEFAHLFLVFHFHGVERSKEEVLCGNAKVIELHHDQGFHQFFGYRNL
jgi:hypothetical protein